MQANANRKHLKFDDDDDDDDNADKVGDNNRKLDSHKDKKVKK